jgi:hypothetical protein
VLPFFATVEPCRIGIEACATGHYWARELRALGHDVRLMAPSYVKPYVKRQKNNAADAEAICEAVGRPFMRFVPVKTAEQQSVMVLHRTGLLLMWQRTRLSNAIRGHMAEHGIVAVGPVLASAIVAAVADPGAFQRGRPAGATDAPGAAPAHVKIERWGAGGRPNRAAARGRASGNASARLMPISTQVLPSGGSSTLESRPGVQPGIAELAAQRVGQPVAVTLRQQRSRP